MIEPEPLMVLNQGLDLPESAPSRGRALSHGSDFERTLGP
jgi:hypothetical protein